MIGLKTKWRNTGKMKVNESAGSGPALHAIVRPFTICSKRPDDGFFLLSSSMITGIRSKTISKSPTDITRIAAAISGAQLQRGGAVHRASLNIVRNAASLTIAELSKGST